MRGTGDDPDVLNRRARSLLIRATVVPVLTMGVLAALLGLRVGAWLAADTEDSTATVVAGQVTRFPISHSAFGPLSLPLMNVGTEPVEIVEVQASDPLSGTPFSRRSAVTLQPDTWRLVPVRVPADCHELETDAVRLLVGRGGAEPVEVRLTLPSESRALRDQQSLACAPRSPTTIRDLAGLWLLDRDFMLEPGRPALLFSARGTYRLDPLGRVFAGPVAEAGSYRVDGASLELLVEEGESTPCEPGERIQLRAYLLEDARLHVHFPADPVDSCATWRDVDLVFSRIAGPDQLPGNPS